MNAYYHRREIMKRFNISRRVIEGYEDLELISPVSKDDRGALLYDEMTVRRIGFIRLLQKMGFELKEIAEFIDGPEKLIKEKLSARALLIKRKGAELDELLTVIEEIKVSGLNDKECEKIIKVLEEEKI